MYKIEIEGVKNESRTEFQVSEMKLKLQEKEDENQRLVFENSATRKRADKQEELYEGLLAESSTWKKNLEE